VRRERRLFLAFPSTDLLQKRYGETAGRMITQVLAIPNKLPLAFGCAICVAKQRLPAQRQNLGEALKENQLEWASVAETRRAVADI
jgi:hypothetical protein